MAVLFVHILSKQKAEEETISQECIMVERKLAFEVFLAGEKSFKQKFFLGIVKVGNGIWGIFLLEYRKFLKGNKLEEGVAMTRLGQMLYDDGVKDGKKAGIKEGIKEGSDKMAALAKVLLASGKMSELQLAIEDKEYREKLMEDYDIR